MAVEHHKSLHIVMFPWLSFGQMNYLKGAFDGMEPALTRFLEEVRPDWIIYDFTPHWLPPIAARLGVSRAFFNIVNAWFVAFCGPSDGSQDYRIKPEDFTVPPKWVKFETTVAYSGVTESVSTMAARNIRPVRIPPTIGPGKLQDMNNVEYDATIFEAISDEKGAADEVHWEYEVRTRKLLQILSSKKGDG